MTTRSTTSPTPFRETITPERSLATPTDPTLRYEALAAPEIVRLTDAAAVKVNAFPNHPGRPSSARNLETHLHVEAWVRNDTFTKHVWLDAHVISDHGEIIARGTWPLRYERPAGDGGDVFVFDAVVFQGSIATPGSVTPRPDARHVAFRVYAEMNGRVHTDARAHRCHLLPDQSST
jgi:hypothetical protein